MPLYLYQNIYASGSIPENWVPAKNGEVTYPVRNQKVKHYLQTLKPGHWKKIIKHGHLGEVHYFEHDSGMVAGVKYISI